MGYRNISERRAWTLKRRIEANRQMVLLKSNPCVDCGGKFPHFVMEWDHVPERGKKICCVSTLFSGRKITAPTIVNELAKCDLVCANCHKVRTYKRTNESLQV